MDITGGNEDAPAHLADERLMAERRNLANIAYRLLGSLTEAEDAVQEAYTRWFAQPVERRDAIANPAAWLTTVVSRICMDQLRSARMRRERYVGEWIPEPLPARAEWSELSHGSTARDPADDITLDESVEMAFLVVLDSMTPAERVAFMLHDVFRVPFNEVAEIVGRTPGACRELASSGRRRVAAARTRGVRARRRSAIVGEFRQAWQAKDVDALVRLLDPSVVAIADGGGRAMASPVPVQGHLRVAELLVHLAGLAGRLDLLERTVNGQPGLVAVNGSEVLTVYAFDIDESRIRRIWAIRNPDKLQSWGS
ncbi:RNA polymerase sigma factor (sigma-70 family) [Streptomyces sp. B3I7]|jgi:RNA polymerase sigma factor (sigma-70 family)|uniref:RNA polymerase sigma factor SigJ n=1 Tax=unclassified Streptomyces TaxID=2593676 RepID=UPI002781C613|nr:MULTISPECIES: RNA polymerase sigma factor SigJ [unclassified Streptomyces]MDQ0787918.1 RNA polymerase sigma factor (sigma-70 family) [Streptomyces sp. B3I8]MDQ0812514.1 RNA polymerase sigma factor (sigma-70 family) [Streptomyces sp. B3I7]